MLEPPGVSKFFNYDENDGTFVNFSQSRYVFDIVENILFLVLVLINQMYGLLDNLTGSNKG